MSSRQIQIQESSSVSRDLAKQVGSVWVSEKRKSEMRQLTLFSALFVGAVAGRVALQFVPSVEPIIPIAILAGLLLGPKEGFSIGSGAYVASNFFVWGLQGPWTLFQAIGAGLPGLAAGLWGKTKSPTGNDLILFSVGGTVFYEILINIFGSVFMMGIVGGGLLAIPLYFLTSMPFSLVHIGSNLVFAKALTPVLEKWRKKTNEFEMVSITRSNAAGQHTHIRLYRAKNP